MAGKTLVVLGSGPGIGIAVAKAFSVRGFTHVALVSRNKDRLAKDEDGVLDAIQERGYSCRVKTWVCDIANLKQLNSTLKEIESFGSLECVLFNPARVAGQPPLEESTDAIEADFRVCELISGQCDYMTDINSSRTLDFSKLPNGLSHC
jgi:NAD(P)-dependent dehydrogenase (short-subunit alcohol dehydrogenase family)